MNTLSIFLISFLSFTLISYFILSRRTLRKILIANHLLNLANEKLFNEHEILKTQFRQLTKIGQLFKKETK